MNVRALTYARRVVVGQAQTKPIVPPENRFGFRALQAVAYHVHRDPRRPLTGAKTEIVTKDSEMDIRVGNGFDVHRFGPGENVILCGVTVPHDRALQGHSDADVGLHTITDAIYGALADGDIGTHFPPSDPQWKGASSDIFLFHAVALADARGFKLSNVDCTLICERPKIGPHAPAMRARLAEIMGLDMSRISVKATTTERLGFTGREEGIACQATVMLVAE